MRVPRVWGATEAETGAAYPCDVHATDSSQDWFRAVTVDADAATVFRWLCQLRVAPYSYDLLDNFGRRSPRTPDPALEQLEVGQRVMTIFRLDSFERDRHITLVLDDPRGRRLFGDFAGTYAVRQVEPQATRLVVKLVVGIGPRVIGPVRRAVIGWGDLLMMRKQLLTLKDLAERDFAVS
jgi:hypothetical protein